MAKEKLIKAVDTEDTSGSITRASGIIVNDGILRPQALPLIVVLPEGASQAQIERAKVLNAYAYAQPIGWEQKKERLLKELEDLKDAPDPIENPNAPKLTVGTPLPE